MHIFWLSDLIAKTLCIIYYAQNRVLLACIKYLSLKLKIKQRFYYTLYMFVYLFIFVQLLSHMIAQNSEKKKFLRTFFNPVGHTIARVDWYSWQPYWINCDRSRLSALSFVQRSFRVTTKSPIFSQN